MSNYQDLVSFVKSFSGPMVELAKTINAWEWASLTGGSLGPTPTSAANVCDTLAASCGWREILMLDLFKQVGVEGRAVNFYNMPFQGNHTTVELKIDGKWVWFDPTFGTYFTAKGGTDPLSVEAARAMWPNVDVKASTMEGWQRKFLDPHSISTAYETYSGNYFYRPMASTTVEGFISGEIRSLYFGGEAGYYSRGVKTPIENPNGLTWKKYDDAADAHAWKRYVDAYDKHGKLDFRWGEYDLESTRHYAWFVDWDQENKYNWHSKTDYIGNVRNGVADYSSIVYDNKAKTIIDYDTAPEEHNWSVKITHISHGGLSDWQEGVFDNGGSWRADWDEMNRYSWSKFVDLYDGDGEIEYTTFFMDGGQTVVVDWEELTTIIATSDSGPVFGTSSREYLLGSDGADTLSGGGGSDRLEGRDGNDTYVVSSIEDIVVEFEGGGSDTILSNHNFVLPLHVENLTLLGGVYGTGNEGDNVIVGNSLDNVLSGDLGNDTLMGMAGNDTLVGGYGNDVIVGGLGKDLLSGGYGLDKFIWSSTAEMGATLSSGDTIRDFQAGRYGDVIDLRSIDANEIAGGNQAFTFIGNKAFTGAGQARITYLSGDTIVLLNTDADAAYEGLLRLSGKKTLLLDNFVL